MKNGIENIMSIDICPFDNIRFTGINLSWREGSERNECDIYGEVDSDTWVIDPKDVDLDIVKKVLEIWIDNLEVIK